MSTRSADAVPSKPDVSVVIPCYNRQRVIERAVRSALLQEGCDIEVIVVDDASSDNSAAIAGAIGDPRISVLNFAENRGGAAARNAGVAAARGDYVAFLDSDDYWLPGKLAAQLRLAKSQPDENWAIYNAILRLEKGVVVPARAFDPQRDDLSTYLMYQHNYMSTSGLLLPKATALKYPFDEVLRCHQDLDLVLNLHARGVRLVFCPLPLACWTFDEGNSRVSVGTDVEPSIYWLNSRWSRLSRPARAEIAAVHIGQKLLSRNPMLGLKYILIGVLSHPPIVSRALRKIVRLVKIWIMRNRPADAAHE